MKVKIRIRLTPWWRQSAQSSARTRVIEVRKPRPERVQPFPVRPQSLRVATPLTIWAMSVLLTIGLLSVSMFATLTPPPAPVPSNQVLAVAINDEDPSHPIVGTVSADCRVMIYLDGRLRCVEALEYHEDASGAVTVGRGSGTRH
jgi:hypothetical protein